MSALEVESPEAGRTDNVGPQDIMQISQPPKQSIIHTPLLHNTVNANLISTTPTNETSTPNANAPTNASMSSSILNLANGIVGAGILGLPYATNQVGWFGFIILLIIFSLLSQFTFQLQTVCAIKYNETNKCLTSSYYKLCEITQISKLNIFVDISISLSILGALCAYLVIIGDIIPDSIQFIFSIENDSILIQRQFWIVIYIVCFIIPTSLLRKLDSLRYTSGTAIICLLYILVAMLVHYHSENTQNVETQAFNADIISILRAIPFIMGGFGCHPLSFTVNNELLNCDNSRMNVVTICAFILTSSLYLTFGIIGYLSFGDKVNSNVLNNFSNSDISIFIARIGLSFAVAFSYPVALTPARQCLSSLIFRKTANELNRYQFYLVSSVFLIVSFVVSMIVSDLGIVLGFFGSLTGPLAAFILPGLFYYYCSHNDLENSNNISGIRDNYNWKWFNSINYYGSIASVVIGTLLIPLCLIAMFI